MEIILQTLTDDSVKLLVGKEYVRNLMQPETVIGTVEIEINNHHIFKNKIMSLLQTGKKYILVDMSQVSYIDSSGIWTLMELTNQSHGQIFYFNLTKDSRRVLDITKVASRMSIFDSESDAMAELDRHHVAQSSQDQ